MPGNLKALDTGGRIVVIGVGGTGFKAEVNLLALMGKRATLRASTLRARPLEEKAQTARLMEQPRARRYFASGALTRAGRRRRSRSTRPRPPTTASPPAASSARSSCCRERRRRQARRRRAGGRAGRGRHARRARHRLDGELPPARARAARPEGPALRRHERGDRAAGARGSACPSSRSRRSRSSTWPSTAPTRSRPTAGWSRAAAARTRARRSSPRRPSASS